MPGVSSGETNLINDLIIRNFCMARIAEDVG